jgi:tRNA(Ile)-lysidine synthase TilS/MesJ
MVEGGLNSYMIYLVHCKNLCKYHNIPLPTTTIKEKLVKLNQHFLTIYCGRGARNFLEYKAKDMSCAVMFNVNL